MDSFGGIWVLACQTGHLEHLDSLGPQVWVFPGRWHCHLEDGDHVLSLSGTSKILKAHRQRDGRCHSTLDNKWPENNLMCWGFLFRLNSWGKWQSFRYFQYISNLKLTSSTSSQDICKRALSLGPCQRRSSWMIGSQALWVKTVTAVGPTLLYVSQSYT